MQTVSLLGIALFFSWLSLAQAQVSIDPAASRVATDIQGPSWHNLNGSFYNRLNPADVIPSVERKATGNPIRYLDIHKQPDGKVGNSTGPVYNPITIHWK
jgi:hypothetical protein